MNVGGVAVLLDNLMSEINEQEFDALLVTGSCKYPETDYLEEKEINYRLERISQFQKPINLKNDVLALISIIRIIRRFQPDIIHTHTSKAGLYGRVASFITFRKAKRIHTFHGHLLVGYFGTLQLFVVKAIERSLAHISDGLVAMGTQVRNDLIDVRIGNSKKFRVILPGLVSPIFLTRVEAQRKLGMSDKTTYCTYIGRLTQIKRLDRILGVAEITKNSNPEIEFLVVGDGDLADHLRNEVEKRSLPVSFLGWRKDIPDLLAASDMLILTSDNEAVALTLIEAAQAGLPIVTTPAGAVRDIALNEFNAIVTGFETQELADAVIKLAESPPLRKAMGERGEALSRENFSISRMTQDHEEFYRQLL
jgi:glycosyltransferase involved in cell wall biosynthesis